MHHIIVRGIGRRKIFNNDHDRDDFLVRLGTIVKETDTACYAWALIPNHFHLLLRTGTTPITTVMRRLLTGYAIVYNRRHRRSGHLFQNRYKSILCQEEPYFMELVRYIHLNPLRAGLVRDMRQLGRYPYAGHSAVMGKCERDYQDVDYVLKRFGRRRDTARRNYRSFVQKGIEKGNQPELIGGGLVRSVGGWKAVKALRKAKAYMKGDERILGDSDFVDEVLRQARENYEHRYRLASKGVTIDDVANRVAKLMRLPTEKVWQKGKQREIVHARSVLCYWAVHELGVSMVLLSKKLNISVTSVGNSVRRGEKITHENDYKLED